MKKYDTYLFVTHYIDIKKKKDYSKRTRDSTLILTFRSGYIISPLGLIRHDKTALKSKFLESHRVIMYHFYRNKEEEKCTIIIIRKKKIYHFIYENFYRRRRNPIRLIIILSISQVFMRQKFAIVFS